MVIQKLIRKAAETNTPNFANMFQGSIQDQLVNLLNMTSGFLSNCAQDDSEKLIEDDPLYFPGRKTNCEKGIFSIADIAQAEVTPYAPQEILDALTDAIGSGTIFSQDAGAPKVRFNIGGYVLNEELENPDIIIAINTVLKASQIKTGVLIAINTDIVTQSLVVDKHILFIGKTLQALSIQASHGFIGIANITCGECRIKNVQFCTNRPIRTSGQGTTATFDLQSVEYNLPEVNAAFERFKAQLQETAEAEFKEFPMGELAAFRFIPFGTECDCTNTGPISDRPESTSGQTIQSHPVLQQCSALIEDVLSGKQNYEDVLKGLPEDLREIFVFIVESRRAADAAAAGKPSDCPAASTEEKPVDTTEQPPVISKNSQFKDQPEILNQIKNITEAAAVDLINHPNEVPTRPLSVEELDALTKLTNSDLRQLMKHFAPEDSIGMTKKELCAQLKLLSTLKGEEVNGVIRKALFDAATAKNAEDSSSEG